MSTIAPLPLLADAVTLPPHVWRSTFLSSPEAGSPANRRDAQLLAAIGLAWAVLSALSGTMCFFFMPPPVGKVVSAAMIGATVAHLGAYALARRGRVRIGLVLQLGAQATATTIIQAAIGVFDEVTGLAMACWFGMCVLTGAAFLRPRAVAALAGTLVLILVFTMALGGAVAPSIMHPVIVFISASAVTIVMRRHRDALEDIHHRQLRDRNKELETLKIHLEDRVTERTTELTSSNAALADAYTTLHSSQQTLICSEKMAAIGRLTAGIAHEMASPLAAVMAAAHDLGLLIDEYGKSIDDPDVEPTDHREMCTEMGAASRLIVTGAERAAIYVRSIRAQTRDHGRRSLQKFDCAAVTRDALSLVAHAARDARCKVVVDAPSEGVELYGPLSRLAQVITNLAHNAIDATGDKGGGEVRITLTDENDGVVIEVVDDGPGIAADVLPHVFEPLFTTKPCGKGTGLGLAIAKEAVEGDFGGKLELTSTEGKGTRVRVELPYKRGNHGA